MKGWRERNDRRLGELHKPPTCLIKFIDKTIRNRLNSIRELEDQTYNEGLSE